MQVFHGDSRLNISKITPDGKSDESPTADRPEGGFTSLVDGASLWLSRLLCFFDFIADQIH
jgi:hypothetical protein